MQFHKLLPLCAVGACLLSACEPSIETIEAAIKKDVEAKGATIQSIECPKDQKIEDGASFDCSVELEGGKVSTVHVTRKGGTVTIDGKVEVSPQTSTSSVMVKDGKGDGSGDGSKREGSGKGDGSGDGSGEGQGKGTGKGDGSGTGDGSGAFAVLSALGAAGVAGSSRDRNGGGLGTRGPAGGTTSGSGAGRATGASAGGSRRSTRCGWASGFIRLKT